MFNIKAMLKVYFVAGSQDCRHLSGSNADNLLHILQQALDAGITCFQFRDKGKYSLMDNPQQQKALAIKCRDLCRQYNVPFIIDDNLSLALEIEADGTHVGQSDMKVQEIISKSDRPFIIGLSVNKMEEALASNHINEIDYFGIGPIFPTQSKEDAKPSVGVDFIKQLRERGINKPLVAIGGIREKDAQVLREKGADGVAVISVITQSEHIAETVKRLLGE
ncbi:thiamine-phosphate diphosphorylase [Bisgaardia hudsonensis]|uniref:Thiamine-phosphate synthase n=1 Tax=Bisgaardia hudsonensis TaxID=109472 RepID=A0A4R2N1V3_9PAST|nr:thiamine phosphate synthase [Bisgaardia hudsonensis]QLB12924.1 thiamine-phosphate diphosphorylase [Bisgaardia hudsonensis]TCP13516.1 thiamine-phosphate diphosphorylase [Bisgaardia hudsonensis]